MESLYCTLFGRISLAIGDGATIDIPRSCHGLLALLALQEEPKIGRAEASFKLWPDTTEKKARHNLSTAIWRLRNCDERLAELFPADSTTEIHLAADSGLDSDYRQLVMAFDTYQFIETPTYDERKIAKGACKKASGDPLPGIGADWADIERERLISLQADFLFRLAVDCEQAGEVEEAIRFGESLVQRDPFREDVHRLLMRLHVQAGNRAKAIAQYRACQGEIGASLGVSPMPETVALYEDLVALPQRTREPRRPEQIKVYSDAIRVNARDALRMGTRQRAKLVELLDYVDRIDRIDMTGASKPEPRS